MPLATTCACGKSLRVQPALAGRKVRCPDCQAICTIPLSVDERQIEDEAFDILLSGPPVPSTGTARPRPSLPIDGTPFPPSRVGPPPLKMAWRPKARTEEPNPKKPTVPEEEGFGHLNGGTIGGILLMVLAVAWYAAGYAGSYFILLPLALLGIGFAVMVKSLRE